MTELDLAYMRRNVQLLPEPVHSFYGAPMFSADEMHAYAAAISAAKDERIKVLEDALRLISGAVESERMVEYQQGIARAALGDKT